MHSECEIAIEALKAENLAEVKRMADYVEEMRLQYESQMAKLRADGEAKADAQLQEIKAGLERERKLQEALQDQEKAQGCEG